MLLMKSPNSISDGDGIQLLEKEPRKMRDRPKDWERSPSISSRGLAVAWKNLTVTAVEKVSRVFGKAEYRSKEIIHNVSGGVQPETLVAILGASGSGKSTLMSVLANRNPAGLEVNGTITIGGKPRGEFIRYISGFVYQDDLFISNLTVMEHLNFTAKLRLGRHTSEKARQILIEEILSVLSLNRIAFSKIGKASFGNAKVNLSGGERKRLSIATELITDPALLFCDEPTTGLDSFTALNVVTNLKSLAILKQKTIICSIHQPNPQIFGLFHQIILLSDGKIAFSGSSADAVTFFKQQGFKYQEDENVAEYLIKSLAEESGSKDGIHKFCSSYETSEYYENTMEFVEKETSRRQFDDAVVFHKLMDEPLWCQKLVYTTHRSSICIMRDLSVLGLRFFQKWLIGFLIGACLTGSVAWTQAGLTALKGAVFFMVSQNFFPSIHVVMMHIPEQLAIFYREYANNTNTPLLFYLSNVLSLLPGFFLDPIVFTLLIMSMSNIMRSISVVFFSCIITTMVLNTSAAFGMLMSLIFSRLDYANAYLVPIEICFVICSGVYVKLSTVPLIMRWIRYVSWFTYACEALFIMQVDGITNIECETNSTDVPCIKTGTEVLATYDFEADNFWLDIIKIFLIYLFLHTVSYLSLLKRLRQRKI